MYSVYVAGPYTGDEQVNSDNAIDTAEKIQTKIGNAVCFVPHLFHYWERRHKHCYATWMNMDAHWLKKCDVLFVMKLSGGVKIEIELARELKIPVVYSLEELELVIHKLVEAKNDSIL